LSAPFRLLKFNINLICDTYYHYIHRLFRPMRRGYYKNTDWQSVYSLLPSLWMWKREQ